MNPVQQREEGRGESRRHFPSERERGSDIGRSVGGCEEGDTGARAAAAARGQSGGGPEVRDGGASQRGPVQRATSGVAALDPLPAPAEGSVLLSRGTSAVGRLHCFGGAKRGAQFGGAAAWPVIIPEFVDALRCLQ